MLKTKLGDYFDVIFQTCLIEIAIDSAVANLIVAPILGVYITTRTYTYAHTSLSKSQVTHVTIFAHVQHYYVSLTLSIMFDAKI